MIDVRAAAFVVSAIAMMVMPAQADSTDTEFASNGLDHLLYVSSSLEQGMDEIESLLGVRPVLGGHHPQFGTHNALLSLGPGIYLEVIARDPDLPAPARAAMIDVAPGTPSKLLTWVYRADDIEGTVAAASDTIDFGVVDSGSRMKPDGSEIRWRFTDPYTMPMDGAVPFLISWGETTHPSLAVPPGGKLVEFVIEHPDPEGVRAALSAIGADIKVVKADQYSLSATIETANGLVTLK